MLLEGKSTATTVLSDGRRKVRLVTADAIDGFGGCEKCWIVSVGRLDRGNRGYCTRYTSPSSCASLIVSRFVRLLTGCSSFGTLFAGVGGGASRRWCVVLIARGQLRRGEV